jgi:tetratricopeptide (TPR) repeat protein
MKYLFIILAALILLPSCSHEKETNPTPVVEEKSEFEILKERTTSNPKDEDAWFRLADLYESANMYAEEVEARKKVVELTPHMGYNYVKLGTAYNKINKYNDAIATFNEAKKYIPNNPVLYNNLGVTYGKVGKLDLEITSLKKAVSLRPSYSSARYNLGIAYLRKGDRAAAMQQYTLLNERDAGAAASLKKEIDAKNK